MKLLNLLLSILPVQVHHQHAEKKAVFVSTQDWRYQFVGFEDGTWNVNPAKDWLRQKREEGLSEIEIALHLGAAIREKLITYSHSANIHFEIG